MVLARLLDERYIDIAATEGPGWWAALERVIAGIDCATCQEHGEMLLSAMHDLVNVQLGKPVYNNKNFEAIAGMYAEAAGVDLIMAEKEEERATWVLDAKAEEELEALLNRWAMGQIPDEEPLADSDMALLLSLGEN